MDGRKYLVTMGRIEENTGPDSLPRGAWLAHGRARKWISDGRIAVNGRKVQDADAWFDPDQDRVTFDGRPLRAARKIYLLLYKPKGYLTTYKDPEGRATIYDLLKDIREWVFPAGRLDQDTSGLLLVTNDTAFGDYVTAPESHVPKTYLVKASELLSEEQLQRLRDGVELSDGPTRPAQVTRVRDSARFTFFEIALTEGRNRQVRRMVRRRSTPKCSSWSEPGSARSKSAASKLEKPGRLRPKKCARFSPGAKLPVRKSPAKRNLKFPAFRDNRGGVTRRSLQILDRPVTRAQQRRGIVGAKRHIEAVQRQTQAQPASLDVGLPLHESSSGRTRRFARAGAGSEAALLPAAKRTVPGSGPGRNADGCVRCRCPLRVLWRPPAWPSRPSARG